MISALIIYTQFFSRIVIPKAVDLSYVRKGVPILTLFGLLLGLISSLFFVLTSLVLPENIAWILTLFFDVLLTGGFHLDGLADTADGLFSSRSKDRMLEIMKDNGVLALIFYYGLMIAMGPYLPQPKWLIVASLSMIGKVGLTIQLYKMRYARESGGSGNFFSGTKTSSILLAQLVPLAVLVGGFWLKGLLAYSLVIIGSLAFRWFVYQKIDGETGDTLGASVEVAQILFLLGMII